MPNLLPALIISLIWGLASVAAALPFALVAGEESVGWTLVGAGLAPFLFVITFVTVAGLLSLPAQKAIIAGKFPREPMHKVYFLRRVYGACWTQVYYFKPIFAVCLAIPLLRTYLFRLFGYRGASMAFTTYPDTWIRDLPVLSIGEGAYLANRATIGTNICLNNGKILVDKVTIGKKALVGHLAMLAPGTAVHDGAEVGVGVAIGIRCVLREGAAVKPSTTINHGGVIGAQADVGTNAYVGMKAVVGPGVKVPAGTHVPAGAVIQSQKDMDALASTEFLKIRDHLGKVSHALAQVRAEPDLGEIRRPGS